MNPKVLEQEEQIVKVLDDVIKDLEQKRNKMRTSSQAKAKPAQKKQDSGNSNSKPDLGGVTGKGDVTSKKQDTTGDWGNLDTKQKSIVVENLVRDLPPHFRDLMKAYFQKLAEETK